MPPWGPSGCGATCRWIPVVARLNPFEELEEKWGKPYPAIPKL